jgi:hypothetical protein
VYYRKHNDRGDTLKVIATALIVGIGFAGLTACGPEDKPAPKETHNSWEMTPQEEAEAKAQIEKDRKEEVFWREISPFIDEYRSADEFWNEREIPDEVKQKAIDAGWKACKVLKNGGSVEAAWESVAEDLGLDLTLGTDSDDAATIVNGAEAGMCPEFY